MTKASLLGLLFSAATTLFSMTANAQHLTYEAVVKGWLKTDSYQCAYNWDIPQLENQLYLVIEDYFKGQATEWSVAHKMNFLPTGYQGPILYKNVQISQRPIQHRRVPIQQTLLLEPKSDKLPRLILAVNSFYYFSVCYARQSPTQSDLVQAEKLSKSILDHFMVDSIYRGAVIEYRGGGTFGFLKGGENAKVTWDDLILEDKLKADLKKGVEGFLARFDATEWKKLGLPLSQGVLLSGAPGTGKSLIAKIIAANVLNKKYRSPFTYMHVQARHVDSIWSLRLIYDMACKLGQTVIVFEDMDLIAGTNRFNRPEIKNELMQQLSGIEPLVGVLTIGTTNLADEIDPALKRSQRLGLHYHFGPLEAPERLKLLEVFLKNKRTTNLDLSFIVQKTESFTGADLQQLVQIALDVVARNHQDGTPMLVDQTHIERALVEYKNTKFKDIK